MMKLFSYRLKSRLIKLACCLLLLLLWVNESHAQRGQQSTFSQLVDDVNLHDTIDDNALSEVNYYFNGKKDQVQLGAQGMSRLRKRTSLDHDFNADSNEPILSQQDDEQRRSLYYYYRQPRNYFRNHQPVIGHWYNVPHKRDCRCLYPGERYRDAIKYSHEGILSRRHPACQNIRFKCPGKPARGPLWKCPWKKFNKRSSSSRRSKWRPYSRKSITSSKGKGSRSSRKRTFSFWSGKGSESSSSSSSRRRGRNLSDEDWNFEENELDDNTDSRSLFWNTWFKYRNQKMTRGKQMAMKTMGKGGKGGYKLPGKPNKKKRVVYLPSYHYLCLQDKIPRPTPSPTRRVPAQPTPVTPTRFPTRPPTSQGPPSLQTDPPTAFPTSSPTTSPTSLPTVAASASPTKAPTSFPTFTPTTSPTDSPTESPSESPTVTPFGNVNGIVFNDWNGNGQQDNRERGIENVNIVIVDSFGTVETVTTDTNGEYETQVRAGAVVTEIVDDTLPPGAVRTAGTDRTTLIVPVDGTATDEDGFQFFGKVRGEVYEDENGNGVRDDGEPGLLINVIVVNRRGEEVILITDENGFYETDVLTGSAVIDLVEGNLPINAVLTAGTDPTTVRVPRGGTATDSDGFQFQTESPSNSPTDMPSDIPTNEPSFTPLDEPTFTPTNEPTLESGLSAIPSTSSSMPSTIQVPSESPSPTKTSELSEIPSISSEPSVTSEPSDTVAPSQEPTKTRAPSASIVPSEVPTNSVAPSGRQSELPTGDPTFGPTAEPSAELETQSPTLSTIPSTTPSFPSSGSPSESSSLGPSASNPTFSPTDEPTGEVITESPTEEAASSSVRPSSSPSEGPSLSPSESDPTFFRTGEPSVEAITEGPTQETTLPVSPSFRPSGSPSEGPTFSPTFEPSPEPVTEIPAIQVPTSEPSVEQATETPTQETIPLVCENDDGIVEKIEQCHSFFSAACEFCEFIELPASANTCESLNEWFCELKCCDVCDGLYEDALLCAEELTNLQGCSTGCTIPLDCDEDNDIGEQIIECHRNNGDSCELCEFAEPLDTANTCESLNEWFCELSCCSECSDAYESAYQCAEEVLDITDCSRECSSAEPSASPSSFTSLIPSESSSIATAVPSVEEPTTEPSTTSPSIFTSLFPSESVLIATAVPSVEEPTAEPSTTFPSSFSSILPSESSSIATAVPSVEEPTAEPSTTFPSSFSSLIPSESSSIATTVPSVEEPTTEPATEAPTNESSQDTPTDEPAILPTRTALATPTRSPTDSPTTSPSLEDDVPTITPSPSGSPIGAPLIPPSFSIAPSESEIISSQVPTEVAPVAPLAPIAPISPIAPASEAGFPGSEETVPLICDQDDDVAADIAECYLENPVSCARCAFVPLPASADTCDGLNEWYCDLFCCDECSSRYEDAYQCAEQLNLVEGCSRECNVPLR